MKRVRTKIDYNETGIYKVNQVTERYYQNYYDKQKGSFIKALHQSAYQICNVYTNQNSVLSAYKKLNGDRATNQVFLDHEDRYIHINYRSLIQQQIQFNDQFNCHGFTFLDAQFWFELNSETVNMIIKDDNYTPCRFQDLLNNGICLYYDLQGQLIHSARMVNGNLLSKFGINHMMTVGEDDVLSRYRYIDRDRTLYFNPAD